MKREFNIADGKEGDVKSTLLCILLQRNKKIILITSPDAGVLNIPCFSQNLKFPTLLCIDAHLWHHIIIHWD